MEENELTLESLIKKQKELAEEAQKIIERQRAAVVASVSEISQQPTKDFYNVPDSPASNIIMETLGAGENIVDLPVRKKKINNNTTYEVSENGKLRKVTLTNKKARVTIEIADIDKITGSNKPAKKLFVLSLIKANEQAIHDGKLTKESITFPLHELIDIGFYKTPQSARIGFKSGMAVLTSLKINGHIDKTKKNKSSIEALEVLFTGARIEDNQCTVYLNPRISWSFMAQYFTILPRYYFKLPNRASDLLYYIFYIARQRTKDIAEKGYFNISFRAIQSTLQLPSEVGNKRPQQTIKQPIENAIELLESEHSKQFNNTDFSLFPVYDDDANIKEFLNNGYLKVTLKKDFAKRYTDISKEKSKKIEQAEKRNARIVEKATAIKMAKAMEDEEKKAAEAEKENGNDS